MYNARSKILKKEEPSALEIDVAKTLYDLEMAQQDIKSYLHDVYIMTAQHFTTTVKGVERKALIVFTHFRSLKPLQKIHTKVVEELEKKFKEPVVMIAQRQILSKHMQKGKTRARNKTLTAVHEAILEDLVFPANIIGKRIRMKIDGTRIFKILIDPLDANVINGKEEILAAVYRKLTNKDITLHYPPNRDFPVQPQLQFQALTKLQTLFLNISSLLSYLSQYHNYLYAVSKDGYD